MSITVELFDKICRVCLTQTTQTKSLFLKQDGDERNLFDILTFTANINIKTNDGLPKQVCGECESLMYKADAFKRRCLESETLLKTISSNSLDDSKGENCGIKVNIKREESDDLDPFFVEPSSSVCKSDLDKDDLATLTACSIESTTCDQDSKALVSLHPDKQEATDSYDDDHHDFDEFPIDFNSTQTFETIPIEFTAENTIKTEEKTYKCCCGLQFTSQAKYTTHAKQKLCSKYRKVFEKLGKIDDIILLNNKLKCIECKSEFNHPNKLIAHQRSVHRKIVQQKKKIKAEKTKLVFITKEDETYPCPQCSRSFKTKKSLNKHIKRHPNMDNNRHECDICKRIFKYKAFLDNHKVARHTKHNNLVCNICLQIFTSEDLLKEHKESQKCEKKHQCNICNRAFGMLCTLKEHMRTHTGEKPFLCSECGKGFSQKTNLGQHMRRHQGLKPFKCENCEKRFVSKGELEAHSRKHSGLHPFVCDDCGNGFTTSSALVKHRRIHTGERPYLCDLCPMRFAASGTLKNHRRIHTGERPFQCVHCEKAFVQRNDLISHIRCHTGEKPYICTQCGQSFRKASGLKTHVKIHVKEPVSMIHHGVKDMLSDINRVNMGNEAMKDNYSGMDSYMSKMGE